MKKEVSLSEKPEKLGGYALEQYAAYSTCLGMIM